VPPRPPRSSKPFLTARWTDLALFTYAVDPALLKHFIPPPLEPDLLNNRAFISLVAFRFLDTRVFGVRWPGYCNFVELNLRCYVRHAERRGVFFIRELVQPRLIAWIARAVYNEPYATCRMGCNVGTPDGGLTVDYHLRLRRREHRLSIIAAGPPFLPAADSREHFFKEHRFGFGRDRRGRAVTYEVLHPPWRVYTPREWQVRIDWNLLYGPKWSFLQDAEPHHVMLAEGSTVAVHPLRPCT
jgi:uncharacterized protein